MISNISAKLWNVSTDKEARPIKKLEWVEYRFLPTPGFEEWRSGQHSIPMVEDWRFSPSGRIGVSILATTASDYDVCLLDVHNKLWFAHSILSDEEEYHEIYTYYMLDEDTLVVVSIDDLLSVKQHLIRVNMETRTAELEQTKEYLFKNRDVRLVFSMYSVPHSYVDVVGKKYTVLVGSSRLDKRRTFVYLVPVNPLESYMPMEYSLQLELPEEHIGLWKSLSGSESYLFRFAHYSSEGMMYFASVLEGNSGNTYDQVVIGIYLTVDVSKLIDIHHRPIDDMEQLDRQQGEESMMIIVYSWARPGYIHEEASRCVYKGDFSTLQPVNMARLMKMEKQMIVCRFFESPQLIQIQAISDSWLNQHPRGAVLQFKMHPVNKRLYVRVAAHWKNTLSSLASNKLIFNPNNQVNSIQHRIIFGNLPPIKLDKTAQKALNGTYKEYKNWLGTVNYST